MLVFAQIWASGTTATLCVFHGSDIYTAWAGDSQAWLVYADNNQFCSADEEISVSPTCYSSGSKSVVKFSSVPGQQFSVNPGYPSGPDNESFKISTNTENESISLDSDLTIGLTDRIHRPEYPSEFVSVLRNGGLISTEVSLEDSPSKVQYFSYIPVADIHRPDVRSSTTGTTLQLPPLTDPNLVDCRVGGLSCVSRSIGDDEAIPGMSALPSLSVWSSSIDSSKHPLCLIVASDGLWDAVNCSPHEVAILANRWFKSHPIKDGLVDNGFARELTKLAADSGALDNITCIVVWMNQWRLKDSKPFSPFQNSWAGKHVQWPRGTRTTSLVDFIASHDFSGTSAGVLNSSGSRRRTSMVIEDSFQSRVRYSSPPRYLPSHMPLSLT